MATRSLTDVFMLMRNNAVRNRNIFPDQVRATFVKGRCSNHDFVFLISEQIFGMKVTNY